MHFLREKFEKHVAATSSSPMGIAIERAEGLWLYGIDGKRYLDMIAGIAVSNLGHSHPAIVAAVQAQVARYMHLMVYGELIQEPQVDLADLLCQHLPPVLSSVYFVNSGTEAVEGALKLAKRVTGRQEIVCCNNAYHGCTHGSMSLIGSQEYHEAFAPLLPQVRRVRFGVLEDLEQITSRTACFITELVQGEAGVRTASPEYWQAARTRCNETGTLFIADEIQTGIGRTGKLFAFEHYNIVPDILVLAKALGGGMPVGAFIASREQMLALTHHPMLGHMTTFGGHPVCCAAALAHLQIITRQQYWKQVDRLGKQLKNVLQKYPGVREIRQIGLMLAVDFKDETTAMTAYKTWLDRGIFIDWFLFCPTALRIAPPLIINEDDIQEFEQRIYEK